MNDYAYFGGEESPDTHRNLMTGELVDVELALQSESLASAIIEAFRPAGELTDLQGFWDESKGRKEPVYG